MACFRIRLNTKKSNERIEKQSKADEFNGNESFITG